MRPLKLTMSAFGPYASCEVVDFAQLGERGLYLITGDTGAGKTTIFDAISYALYERPSGGDRAASMFRSKYAEPDVPTFVELTFLYAGKEYTVRRNPEYERPARRGGGTTMQKAEAELHLPDGAVITRREEVNSRIKDIIGLDSSQFSQIAMIAQGDFKKLLLADTKDRQTIFREIFKTDYYMEFQRETKNEALKLQKECESVRASIEQYVNGLVCAENDPLRPRLDAARSGGLPVDEINELITTMIERDKQAEEAARSKLDGLNEALSKADALIARGEEREKTQKQLELEKSNRTALRSAEAEAEAALTAEIERCARRDEYAAALAALEAELPRYQELAKLKTECAAHEQTRAAHEDSKARQETEQQARAEELERYKLELEELGQPEAERERLLSAAEKSARRKAALNRLIEKSMRCEEKRTELKREQELYSAAAARAEAAQEKFSRDNKAFMDEQAGLLAQSLSEGKPCPVCGALQHPSPAKVSPGAPTEAELEASKQRAEAALSKATELSQSAGRLKAALEELENQLAEELALCDEEICDGQSELEIRLKAALAEADAELSRIATSQKETERRIDRKAALKERIPLCEQKIQTLAADIQTSTAYLAADNIRLENAARQINALKAALRFEEAERAKEEIDRLRAQIGAMDKAREVSEAALSECRTRLAKTESSIASLAQLIENCENVDIAEQRRAKAELTQQRSAAAEEQNRIHAALAANVAARDNVERRTAELTGREKKLSWLKALSDTVNGTLSGKEKIALETYVQMTFFEQIIRRANIRLLVMTGGQYELTRCREAESKKGQSGLELDVIDHYNGTQRSVKSLSGGETFKASLSLALGLSDEIQSTAGGVKLDAMFVDEGFGSLDDASLEQAIRALADLTDGNRLVGIISHVSGLKEKIDRQIVVSKDRSSGSHVRLYL